MSLTISSVTSTVCSLHVSPLSDLRTTISLSHPRSDPKFGTSIMTGLLHGTIIIATKLIKYSRHFVSAVLGCIKLYPRNFAPTGPSSSILLASDSPSISGGGCTSFSRLRYRQVTRVGIEARRGGTITRTPLCRQPRIAPPRASTKKLTKNL